MNRKLCINVGLLVLTPMALAAYGKRPIEFTLEGRAQLISDAWHTRATSSADHLDAVTSAITNAGAYTYKKSIDQMNNYSFGGRFCAKTKYASEITLMVGIGFESGIYDGKGYRPLDPAQDGIAIGEDEWLEQSTTAMANWSGNMVLVPSVFVGYGPLAVGVEYDTREYTISGHEAQNRAYLNGRRKDNQTLYGLRGESRFDLDYRTMILSFEVMTNLARDADDEMKEYFVNLAKYGTDVKNIVYQNEAINTSSGFGTTGVAALPASRAKVNSVNTYITKASVGFGVLFGVF